MLDLTLTNRVLSAAEAEAWGLVNRVVPDDEVDTATAALAQQLADGATLATGLAKRVVYQGYELGLADAGELEGAHDHAGDGRPRRPRGHRRLRREAGADVPRGIEQAGMRASQRGRSTPRSRWRWASAVFVVATVAGVDGSPPPVAVVPGPLDCSRADVVVFGSSTDYAAGVGKHNIPRAWPEVLERDFGSDSEVVGLRVTNEARPGSTSTVKSIWGAADEFRVITHIPDVFDRYSDERRERTLVIVSPSIADLQINHGDIDEAVDGIEQIVELLDSLGIRRTLVLPMNPTAHRSIANFDRPGLNRQVQAFNEQLLSVGLLPRSYAESPLLSANGVDGATAVLRRLREP